MGQEEEERLARADDVDLIERDIVFRRRGNSKYYYYQFHHPLMRGNPTRIPHASTGTTGL